MSFSALVARIGIAQATQELRWIKRAANSSLSLSHLISRRTLGEPLQYILGSPPAPNSP